jgi:hypothetical protein
MGQPHPQLVQRYFASYPFLNFLSFSELIRVPFLSVLHTRDVWFMVWRQLLRTLHRLRLGRQDRTRSLCSFF